jgi:hypothetical protein
VLAVFIRCKVGNLQLYSWQRFAVRIKLTSLVIWIEYYSKLLTRTTAWTMNRSSRRNTKSRKTLLSEWSPRD